MQHFKYKTYYRKTILKERRIDRRAHRDTDKCSEATIGTRAEESRKKKNKNTRCRGSLRSSLSDCKFPHLKNGEIHFSHRWEQARLISLKYPICWWERGGERGRKKKRQTRVNQTKQFACPGIICFPSNDVCVCVSGSDVCVSGSDES